MKKHFERVYGGKQVFSKEVDFTKEIIEELDEFAGNLSIEFRESLRTYFVDKSDIAMYEGVAGFAIYEEDLSDDPFVKVLTSNDMAKKVIEYCEEEYAGVDDIELTNEELESHAAEFDRIAEMIREAKK